MISVFFFRWPGQRVRRGTHTFSGFLFCPLLACLCIFLLACLLDWPVGRFCLVQALSVFFFAFLFACLFCCLGWGRLLCFGMFAFFCCLLLCYLSLSLINLFVCLSDWWIYLDWIWVEVDWLIDWWTMFCCFLLFFFCFCAVLASSGPLKKGFGSKGFLEWKTPSESCGSWNTPKPFKNLSNSENPQKPIRLPGFRAWAQLGFSVSPKQNFRRPQVRNLDRNIDNKALYDTFSLFGNILSCKADIETSLPLRWVLKCQRRPGPKGKRTLCLFGLVSEVPQERTFW